MSPVSLQDVANIVTFIAPGYFAIQIYSLVYAKKERDFSRLLIESVVYSLPIVTLANFLWQKVFRQAAVENLNVAYAFTLLLTAVAVGGAVTALRVRWPIKHIAARYGLGSPNEDFVKTQLLRIDLKDPHNNAITVTLKSGAVFSGTIDRFSLSRYAQDAPQHYYFTNLAWFNDETDMWEEREGGLIVERSEIEYIETPKLKDS
ncbi:MAG: hypothetical protein JWL85_482 [Candidatus Saccharibacteria bacterium]|nr:hypothetical protein [Candidatus Saccharibacteria bacterium]